MSVSKSFYKLFVESDDISQEWENKFFEYGRKFDKEKLEEHLCSANEVFFDEKTIYTAINRFTLSTVPLEEKRKLFEELKNEEFIKSVKVLDNDVIIETLDKKIVATKFSSLVPKFSKEDGDLENERRQGVCHLKSMKISKNLGIPNDVVTGYIYGYSDKSKFLHSWVEFNYDGEDTVIDYTLNVLMNKEGYYYMQHAVPISRVSDENLRKDNEIIKKFEKIGYFNLKEYLVFRDEIMKDFDKNKKIFDEER